MFELPRSNTAVTSADSHWRHCKNHPLFVAWLGRTCFAEAWDMEIKGLQKDDSNAYPKMKDARSFSNHFGEFEPSEGLHFWWPGWRLCVRASSCCAELHGLLCDPLAGSRLVEDDGWSTRYLQGEFAATALRWSDGQKILSWQKSGYAAQGATKQGEDMTISRCILLFLSDKWIHMVEFFLKSTPMIPVIKHDCTIYRLSLCSQKKAHGYNMPFILYTDSSPERLQILTQPLLTSPCRGYAPC